MALDVALRARPTATRRGERRHAERWDCFIRATAEIEGREFPCIVTDRSVVGAGGWCAGAERARVGTPITLRLPQRGSQRATIRHVTGDLVGVEYVDAA